ncbi:DUF1499 domain-containing protein [Spirulina subsalsa FACHB-351]|uniref:DUF1499 domain-containing protein n=1 Tax=Spirulina subsalsa FACHB-351 TaxID=234711 RepID=A0ABT3KZT3_9CYAN|nr:DUF1499 domain-containing protein [Spirulina subsalsa]MCW6034773.1 DUF1499 domain-containing protein [Spirulina subsalsa FACHB-351]
MTNTQTTRKVSPSRIFLIAALVFILGWVGMRLLAPERPTLFAGSRPANLGVEAGQLAPCPPTPNCVNSQSTLPSQAIPPLTVSGNPEQAVPQIEQVVKQIDRTRIITRTDRYLYAQFSSRWMGFVDDVEFVLNPEQKWVDVRSASRLGESDLGVNRQRVEEIRVKLSALEF